MRGTCLLGFVAAVSIAGSITAQTIRSYQLSTDVPATLGSETVTDADVVELDPATPAYMLVDMLGSVLPAGVGVDAVTVFADGEVAFSTDVAFTADGTPYEDEDVVLDSAGTLTLLLDGSAAGIPAEADVDAIHVIDRSVPVILLSFDRDVEIEGAAYTDDDIVRYDGATGGFSLELAGSSWLGSGTSRADVDGLAATLGPTTRYYLSTDVSVTAGTAGGADDEDVITVENQSVTSILDLSGFSFPGDRTDVDGLDVETPPGLSDPAVSYAIVNTATPVTWSAVYTDADNDPPLPTSPALMVDSSAAGLLTSDTSSCGTLCDGAMWNGERYLASGTVSAGATHAFTITADDGLAQTTATGSGPSWVSVPGDADGDGDRDAEDLARILVENFDANGGSDLDLVRGGTFTGSWGGTDADSDHMVDRGDLPAAVGTIF